MTLQIYCDSDSLILREPIIRITQGIFSTTETWQALLLFTRDLRRVPQVTTTILTILDSALFTQVLPSLL